MENILEELNQIPGVQGSMIVGKDGLVIVPMWNQDVDMDMIGADSADLLGLVESLTMDKLNAGKVDLITMEAETVKFFVKNIDEATFIVVAAESNCNLGLVRLQIKSAANKIMEVL